MIKASPRKTRRRGLRRITSALISAALAAVVPVSTANAQQSGPAGALPIDRLASSSAKAEEGTSVGKAIGDPVYGMSSTRGARYLLRNGLDYLNYGEYQRALKFLRETESRKYELNDAENLVLKKSIENAQRGLREASDAEAPYALSDQAGNHNGFSPAKPDTHTTRRYNWPTVSEHRKSMLNKSKIPRAAVNNSDDDGELIRVARGDDDSIAASSHNPVTPKLSRTNNDDDNSDRYDSNHPRQFPEIPELPRYSQEPKEPVNQPPNTTGPAQAPSVDRAQNENLIQTAADPGRQLPLADTKVVSEDSSVLVHAETEDIKPLQMHEQPPSAPLTPASSSLSRPVAIEEADHLPHSQTDQDSRIELANKVLPSSTTTTAVTNKAPIGIDKLPPLPANLSESAAPLHSAVKLVSTPIVVSNPQETAPFPPLLAKDEDRTVDNTRAVETVPSLAQSTTVAQRAAVQNGLSLGSAESIGLPLNSPFVGPNPESAQEVVARLSLNNDALDAPPPLPPEIDKSNSLSSRIDSIVPSRPSPPSTLRPELKREVETIARKQEDELLRRQQAQPVAPARDTIISDLRAQTQLDISRAPSPAEARPIKAIPVPEDWVSLAPRNWLAQRKYWAAAATCHLPLYFQDPVLERYGHSVEQFVGPISRHLTYPLDAPSQSTQRNQILQPFFSAGLFAFQIAALPYNAIVDPPWEAQYDLGYYRPGDVIPTDTYWLPLHGYGPLLQGSNY
jgi:hypothetical protein